MQVVARVVGGRHELDVEAVEELSRAEVGLRQRRCDLVVDRICGLGRRPYGHPENLDELRLHPVPDRRAAEDVPVAAERPPRRAGLGVAQRDLARRDAEG
jgi:hypothetical protein